MDKIAIIVAAGSGTRMQTDLPKQFLPLAGKAILLHTLEAFFQAYGDIKIILVLPKDQITYGQELLKEQPYHPQVSFIAGGDSRFQSVAGGLRLIEQQNRDSIVFVHDGVRCLVTPELIRRCYDKAVTEGSAIPVCPVTDSLRTIHQGDNEQSAGSSAIDRESIRLVQTPQTFRSSILIKAFKQPYRASFTDEASVLESSGMQVHLVEGDPENIKITRPVDLLIAEAILEQR